MPSSQLYLALKTGGSMSFNYNHLYYFYVAAKVGGITAAAEELHVSQPSLSSQLKVLEEFLGLKLFEKVGRRNKLTDSGSLIYEYCRKMFEVSAKMKSSISKSNPTNNKKIKIGVSSELEKEFITEVLSHYLGQLPIKERPQINIFSGTANQLIDHLHFGEIDLLVSSETIIDQEYYELQEVQVPIVLCCSKKTNRFEIDMDEVSLSSETIVSEILKTKNMHWVLPSGPMALRSQIDKFFDERKIDKNIVFESDSLPAIVRSVQNDLGLSFLPLFNVTSQASGQSLLRIGAKKDSWIFRISLGCHVKNKYDRLIVDVAKAFKEKVEQENKQVKEVTNLDSSLMSLA